MSRGQHTPHTFDELKITDSFIFTESKAIKMLYLNLDFVSCQLDLNIWVIIVRTIAAGVCSDALMF